MRKSLAMLAAEMLAQGADLCKRDVCMCPYAIAKRAVVLAIVRCMHAWCLPHDVGLLIASQLTV